MLAVFTAALALAAGDCLAASNTGHVKLSFSAEQESALRLEARDAPLGQILAEISKKTGAIIHYSVLPEALVTATCAGANVGQIMDCLAAKQIGVVGHKAQKEKPAEFWLLGSSVGSCQAVTAATQTEINQPIVEKPPTPEEQTQTDQAMQEQSDRLIEQAKSKDPAQRSEALSNLVSAGVKDDPNVRKALEVR